MKVEIWSDVVCPWCYIGKRRFERALAAFPGAGQVEVVYRPYQLDPGAPAEPMPTKQRLAQRYGGSVEAMVRNAADAAKAEGLVMDFDRMLSANTLAAHRLLAMAEAEHGAEVQRDVAERLFRAHFTNGADVGDPDVLARIAGEAGMDAARVRGRLAAGEGLTEVRREIGEARAMGITAVPTFVFDGRWAVQGAQPASAFLQALEAVAAETAAVPAGDAAGGACADDACIV
ncbi:MAG TPA: DsbA family oxidoreductase [Longimicrobium sp.]|nr:DsbA family oxidoreductase [Longimicrobium sp.]